MVDSKKEPLVGTQIREYEILDVIAKGGMGVVYRARHIYLDEERAIKVIRGHYAEEQGLVDRFIREAKILSRLRHVNLVQLYEFGRLDEQTFFMVMELIRGQSVLERIRSLGRIPVVDSIRIAREAALGLHCAHEQGIVHRDISPDNILLVATDSGAEIAKVIDFGIAKPLFERTEQFTATNMLLGKPEYCSPEQCGMLEEGEVIDRRSDIYSLGITLYCMLAGRTPFHSTSPQGYLIKHVNETPKSVSTHFPAGEIPEALDRLLLKALSKRREERHSTMEELVRELDMIGADGTTQTADVPPLFRPVRARLEPGELFAGRYLIDTRIGKGGMGTVYKAMDKILDVPVALKVMNTIVTKDEKALQRLKREVILARKVAHANACRIYDIGESDNIHYVSMEFLSGRTLAEMLQLQGRLPITVGVSILSQVLQALEEAHRVGVIHRDLKPQNIMVDFGQRSYIMDFGISISSEVRRVTETGVLIGTPQYMAPEQFEGKTIDQRTDIYAIGIIAFEMFTGRLPFEATTPIAAMNAHLNSMPPKPTDLVPDFPTELEEVILKSLHKDPAKRFQNVHQLLFALEPLGKSIRSTTSRQPSELREEYPIRRISPGTPKEDTSRKSVSSLLPSYSTIPQKVATQGSTVLPPTTPEILREPARPGMKLVPSSVRVAPIRRALPWVLLALALIALFGVNWLIKSGGPTVEHESRAIQPAGVGRATPEKQQLLTPIPEQNKNPASQESREIYVQTVPPGASIFLDGKETGYRTPRTISFSTDQTHRMVLRLQGYEPRTQTVDKKSSNTLLISLAALPPGYLSCQSGYPVLIYNGTQMILNPAFQYSTQLPPGSYTLTVISDKKAVIHDVQTVEVRSEQTSYIKMPTMGTLTVKTTPGNCKVSIDGSYMEIAPVFDLPVQTGSHRIQFAWEKLGAEQAKSFFIAAAQKKTITAILKEGAVEVYEDSE